MNKVFLVGRLGQEVRYLKSVTGKEVANLRVATKGFVKDEEVTEWHDIECWGTQARTCMEQLKKGDRVAIEGSIRTSTWEENDPEHGPITRSVKKIVAHHVEFLFDKKEKGIPNVGQGSS